MRYKKYYRIEFELISALAVGSGENLETDKDIAVNSKGNPYIPGTAMAGVYRKLLTVDLADKYFGKNLELQENLTESRVIVYDANPVENNENYVTKRDMVALDEFKTARPGMKFDFQILEPGVTFVTYAEENLDDESDEGIMSRILSIWNKYEISVGAKTSRGYGRMELKKEEIKVVKFSMTETADREKWLNFNLYNKYDRNWEAWSGSEQEPFATADNHLVLKLKLRQRGGISIRQYSTRVGEADYEQLHLHRSSDGTERVSVIPGTSWAGVFCAQMKKLGLTEKEATYFFGEKTGKNSGHKSKIAFSESQIKGGTDLVFTRNAIDRFTGGTVDGALYTERTHYCGGTDLNISVELLERNPGEQRFLHILAAAIMDLHYGYMAVGGLTAVGRGLFAVEKIYINGTELYRETGEQEPEYSNLMKAMEKAALIGCENGKTV